MWRGPGATFRSARNYETPHIRHGLRPMTPSPQGEGFSLKPLSPTSNDRTPPSSEGGKASPVSAYRIRQAGHAAAPTHKLDLPYRPSSRPFGATFPRGKVNPRQVGSLLQSPTVHPLRATQAWPTSPYTPGGIRSAGVFPEFGASGRDAAPTNEIGGASRPSSVMAYAMTLRNGMTATGSHEYFYSLRGAQPPGEGLRPAGFCV